MATTIRSRRILCRQVVQLQQWVKGGHAEQVAAAAGSPQKAALLAAGRDFGLGPIAAMRTQAYVGMKRGPSVRFWMFRSLFRQALK
jgi:hypothetical protein